MSEDALPTTANRTGDAVVPRSVRRRPCTYTLLAGAILGILVGSLNFAAFYNHWKLLEDFFDIVDAPLNSLLAPHDWRVLPKDSTSYAPATICYWAIIGLFAASLICLVRGGVVRDIDHFTRAVCRKPCRNTLLLGVTLGILCGILNLAAANCHWKVQRDFFGIIDAPIDSLVGRFDSDGLVAPIFSQDNTFVVDMVLAVICYWAIIGLFLASLIYLVRNGVLREIVCDRICCYLLFFGTCGGILIGKLSFLADSNGWDVLNNLFSSLNQPVISLMVALQRRYRLLDLVAPGSQSVFMRRNAVIIYWTFVCLFVTSIYCVIRILKRRKNANEGTIMPQKIS
jgi:hypothetical protein